MVWVVIDYATCTECARPMRKWGWLKKDHPHTVAKGMNGLCNVCNERKQKGKSVATRNQDVKLVAAVDRYVSMRTEGFKQLYGGTANERAALARKAAPEDTWQTLGI